MTPDFVAFAAIVAGSVDPSLSTTGGLGFGWAGWLVSAGFELTDAEGALLSGMYSTGIVLGPWFTTMCLTFWDRGW